MPETSFFSEDRLIKIKTPLPDDTFTVMGFSGTEALSTLYRFDIDLISTDHRIAFHDILGANASLYVEIEGVKKIVFNGIICRFTQGSGGGEEGSAARYSYYSATVVPKLWLATQTKKIRKWLEMTSSDVIRSIMGEYNFTGNLADTSFTHDYVLQYNESDFNVIARLLEEEDMYFYFSQNEDSAEHEMVTVKPPGNPAVLGIATYRTVGGGLDEGDLILSLSVTEEIKPNVAKLADQVPKQTVDIVEGLNRSEAFPSELPVREYPGDIEDPGRADLKAKIRLGTEQAVKKILDGTSNCMDFRCGKRFILSGHYRSELNDQKYLLTAVHHQCHQDLRGEFFYSNSFTCIPSDTLYRAPRTAQRPKVQGSQTAVVTEMPDQDGWIKVRVPWGGPSDEMLEHPRARVCQPWAGEGFGAVFVPRLDHEVVLDFIDGDPHKPVVTGRVYNLTNKPGYPFTRWTKTTIKSESMSPDGAAGSGSNEITFEDETGNEEIYVHAERNLNTVVEASETRGVGGNRTTTIQKNETLTVKEGDRTTTLDMGNDTLHLKVKDRNVVLDMGNHALKISMGNETTTLDLGKSTTQALQSIELKVGQSSLKVDQMGVTLRGMMIRIEGSMMVQLRGMMTTVEGSAMVRIGGGLVMIG